MRTALIIAGIVIVALCCGGYYWGSESTMTCTVTEKDRTSKQDGSSSMRVYTEECGVLEAGDAPPRGVWDSADLYAGIESGGTYEFTTVGWRIPFLSMFPTIIESHEVSGADA